VTLNFVYTSNYIKAGDAFSVSNTSLKGAYEVRNEMDSESALI